jgi:hypothetical protein
MRVDSFTKVEKLNADLLDGQNADQFVPLGGKAFNFDNLDGNDSTAFFSGRTYVRSSDAVRGDGVGSRKLPLRRPAIQETTS